MPVSNKARQARHRAAHPDRELARQQAKRARTPSGKGRVAPRKCAMARHGGCGGAVEFHHAAGYSGKGKSHGRYLCKAHHEQTPQDRQA